MSWSEPNNVIYEFARSRNADRCARMLFRGMLGTDKDYDGDTIFAHTSPLLNYHQRLAVGILALVGTFE